MVYERFILNTPVFIKHSRIFKTCMSFMNRDGIGLFTTGRDCPTGKQEDWLVLISDSNGLGPFSRYMFMTNGMLASGLDDDNDQCA